MGKPKAPKPLPDDWKGNPDGTPKIVSAVAALTGVGELGSSAPAQSKRIEAAMAQAVLDANAEGIPMTDTESIRARMLAARQTVIDEG